MLVRDTKAVYRHQVMQAVGKEATRDEVLAYLFGDEDGWTDNNFVIREWSDDDKRTPLQRLNMFWAIPFTLLVSPYQYVVKGRVGWDTKTRFSRWILRVTGHLKET